MNSEKYYNNTIMTFEVYKKNSIFIYLICLSGIDMVVHIWLQATGSWVEPSIKIPGISGGVTACKRVRGDTSGVDDSVTCDGGTVFGSFSHSFSSNGEPLTFYLIIFGFWNYNNHIFICINNINSFIKRIDFDTC